MNLLYIAVAFLEVTILTIMFHVVGELKTTKRTNKKVKRAMGWTLALGIITISACIYLAWISN